MRLLLVRHGETEQNSLGVMQGHQPGVLTARGAQQAQALAERLKHEKIELAYCSDLARAVDTIRPISERHPQLRIELCEELRERALGIYEGRHGKFYHEDFAQSGVSRIDFKPQGGESIIEVQKRTDRFLKQLREKAPDQTVLVCTHGGVIVTILATLLDTPLDEMLTHSFLNTSLTKLEIEADLVQVKSFNCIEHLREIKVLENFKF